MRKSFLALWVLAIVLPFSLAADQQWVLEKDQNNIKVYVREVPGSSLKEFKAIMYLKDTKLASLLALMEDVPSYPHWMYNCIEASLVRKINTYERIIYTVTDAPWPVSDRDIVTYIKISQNPKTLAITIALQASPHSVAPKSGRIRVPRLTGFWYFQPLSSGYTMIIYQLHSDPGGSLPTVLANSAVIDIPFNTFAKMRYQVNKYKNAQYAEIKELKK